MKALFHVDKSISKQKVWAGESETDDAGEGKPEIIAVTKRPWHTSQK
jgi:hypothetical protein